MRFAETRRFLAFLMMLSLIALSPACVRRPPPPTPVSLSIAGSTSMRPLLETLAHAYSSRYPHVAIEVRGGGSALGLELLMAGEVDLAASSVEVEGKGLQAIEVARDGIAVVVHPANPVQGLALWQLQDIFSGRILEWTEVGGKDEHIQVVVREEGSGTRAVFEKRVMGGRRTVLTAVVMPSSQAVVDYVARNRGAIGYVSTGCLSSRVKAIAIEGVRPEQEALERGEYPLTRFLFLVDGKRTSEEARHFIEFALSPTGQSLLGDGYGRAK